ncbi:MAG: hypothetical protein FWE31_05955 [Firmicutes bacterium]|nr:hypothetical protein [Bacillota bacterium]
MRGIKLTVAIISIIIGAFGILGGVAITIMGAVGAAFIADIANDMNFSGAVAAIFVSMGLVVLAISIAYLVLGIKFTSQKPNKGVAIALLVFYIIGSLSLFSFDPVIIVSSLLSVAMAALLIVYLAKLGKQQQPPILS